MSSNSRGLVALVVVALLLQDAAASQVIRIRVTGSTGGGGGGANPIAAARLPGGSAALPVPVWAAAGVEGGIPSGAWTRSGSLIASGASVATIQTALNGCGTNHYVELGSGAFSLAGGLTIPSNCELRGQGANATLVTFTSNTSCVGANAAVCFQGGDGSDYFGDSKMQPGGTNAATWTSGYAQGATSIVLSSIGTNGITVGKWIYLDQNEDVATNSGFFVCESTAASPHCAHEGGAGDPGRIVGGVARQQVQMVRVTACTPSCTAGSTFTITPGLYAPNYATGYAPGAWWPQATTSNAGIINLSLTSTSDTNNIALFNAHNIWISGCRIIRTIGTRDFIQLHAASHTTVQNNYFYGAQGQSQNYAVESFITTDALIQNNIFQTVVVPMMMHSNQGSVYAYNYTINNSYNDGGTNTTMANSIAGHSAGVMYNLFEGNIVAGIGADGFHGNQVVNTIFRNYVLGKDPNKTQQTMAFYMNPWSRYYNIVGNVLGTPSYHTSYAGGGDLSVYDIGGSWATLPADPLVASTMLRWGNWDVVSNATRWCGGASNTGWVSVCGSASEVPTGASTYPNAVPSTETLPSSLFLSAKPSWWPVSLTWPPIGPDVTGGSLTGLGGHVYSIPARTCYLTTMSGPTDGSGSVLSFNASTCYP